MTGTVEPNALDRMIGAIAPGWACERMRARAQLAVMTKRMAHFDAAKPGRSGLLRRARSTGPNAARGGEGDRLRDIARDLARNNPYATNAVRSLASHIVGTGIVPRFEEGSKTARQRGRDKWSRFSDTCDPEGLSDYYSLQYMGAMAHVRDGEVLRVWSYEEDGLRCQLREIDYLDSSKNEIARDGSGHRIIQGVEYDRRGRRVAYWMFPEHPGEYGLLRTSFASQRVSARFVDAMLFRDRPGQARGVSIFASAARKLKAYNDLEMAMIDRRTLETYFAIFVERDSQAAADGVPIGGETEDAADGGAPFETIESMSTVYGQPGEKPHAMSITSPGDSAEFGTIMLHGVAVAFGLPYHILSGDVSKANYTSQRAANVNFHRFLDARQKFEMKPMFNAPAWARLKDYEMAMNGGRLGNLDKLRCIWTPPARVFIDPKKDGEAEIAAIENGLKSLPDALAERGLDPEETARERAAYNLVLQSLGLPVVGGSAGKGKGQSDDADDKSDD